MLDDARLELPGVRPRLLSDETIVLAHDLDAIEQWLTTVTTAPSAR